MRSIGEVSGRQHDPASARARLDLSCWTLRARRVPGPPKCWPAYAALAEWSLNKLLAVGNHQEIASERFRPTRAVDGLGRRSVRPPEPPNDASPRTARPRSTRNALTHPEDFYWPRDMGLETAWDAHESHRHTHSSVYLQGLQICGFRVLRCRPLDSRIGPVRAPSTAQLVVFADARIRGHSIATGQQGP